MTGLTFDGHAAVERAKAGPRLVCSGFAAGVIKLDCRYRALRFDESADAPQRFYVLIFPDAHVAHRAQPAPFDLGGLGEDNTGAAHRELRKMGEMPIGDEPVARRVLRHGRDDNAIAQFNAADLQRRK